MKKINAFTLIELMVVIILLSLLIGISILAFSIISRQVNNFMTQQKDLYQLKELEYILTKDISQGEYLFLEEGNTLKILLNNNDSVKYLFNDSIITRRQGLTEFNYFGKTSSLAFFKLHPENLVHELQFNFTNGAITSELIFSKEYSSSQLIENSSE